MTTFPTDVEVGIVAHNARATIGQVLDSLTGAGCPESNILVVDVGSSDGLHTWLGETRPVIRRLSLDRNSGPGPGRNLAIRAATRPYVFLMDADVEVEPDTVALLRHEMARDPGIAVGSPVVVHLDRPDVIQYAGTWLHFICEAINPWLDRPLRERSEASVDLGCASTCGLLLRRDVAIHVGLFDERYFIGKEDGDFTHRVKLSGHRIVEPPHARVRHRSRPRNDWLFYFQIRNRWHFLLKNYELRTLVVIAPALVVHEALQLAALTWKGYLGVYLRALLGLIRMLPALPGDRSLVARIRVVHDRAVLRAGPMVVRDDVGPGPSARARVLYDAWLQSYWRVAQRLLPA